VAYIAFGVDVQQWIRIRNDSSTLIVVKIQLSVQEKKQIK
jgi:hypothetical protein